MRRREVRLVLFGGGCEVGCLDTQVRNIYYRSPCLLNIWRIEVHERYP